MPDKGQFRMQIRRAVNTAYCYICDRRLKTFDVSYILFPDHIYEVLKIVFL